MSLVLGQALAGTTATFITAVPAGPFTMTIVTGGTAVAMGTSTAVTFANGAIVNATSFVQYEGFTESAGGSLYGVTAAGTATVSYHLSTDH